MIKGKRFLIASISILATIGISLLMYINKPNIEDVKARHEASLMNIPGVVGVSIGECDKQPCIKVYLEKKILESKNIPKQLEGFKVAVEVTGPIEALGQVKIQTDRDTYIPSISSTVGIGLTPIYTEERELETVKFHWRTNYGYFMSWNLPNCRVNILGPEIVNNGEKIYWSYAPNEMGVKKPFVQISLNVEDAQSGQVLTNSILGIEWEKQDISKVKK